MAQRVMTLLFVVVVDDDDDDDDDDDAGVLEPNRGRWLYRRHRTHFIQHFGEHQVHYIM